MGVCRYVGMCAFGCLHGYVHKWCMGMYICGCIGMCIFGCMGLCVCVGRGCLCVSMGYICKGLGCV